MKRSISLLRYRLLHLLPCLTLIGLVICPVKGAPVQTAPFSAQETMASLLLKGELTLVETRPDSNLKQVTAITVVKRPIEEVWKRLTDYPAYLKWMPKVNEASIVRRDASKTDVQWEIEVPGPNYRYVGRCTEDHAAFTLEQHQIEGSLKGSHWTWQLVSQGPDATLVFRTVYTNVTGESWIARQADDESHTLSYGINVSTSLVEVRALRRTLEQAR